MVLESFPLLKIAALFIRHISRPLVTKILDHTKTHPRFRNTFIIPPAQFYNWCNVRLKMWIMNLGKPREVPKMSEAQAIELGCNMLGESIIFVTAATLLLHEYMRSVRKEAAKEEARKNEIKELQEAVMKLYLKSEEHTDQIKTLISMINNINEESSQTKPVTPFPSSQQYSPDYPTGTGPRQTHSVEGDEL